MHFAVKLSFKQLLLRIIFKRLMQHTLYHKELFLLESGGYLPDLTISYHTYGQLNEQKDNVIWICHALTASSDAAGWWNGLVGEGKIFDPRRHFIVCANILGSCYGTTGPLSVNRETGMPFYSSFPFITIRDMVQAHIVLRKALGIDHISVLAGGSMGGYQCLEWALMEKERIGRLFLLATSAAESAWGIAIHTAQRMAIEADGTFYLKEENAGSKGLKAARAIGLITYRNYHLIKEQQSDNDNNKIDLFKVSSYLNYQGDKLVSRFNALSYWVLSKAMDTHNISRNREKRLDETIKMINNQTLLIGISSDILCPPEEQRALAEALPFCRYEEIASPYGHDGFLIESDKISHIFLAWLDN